MDRAYTSHPGMSARMPDGRLHPALTGMGWQAYRSRGNVQKNSYVMPVATRTAQPDPTAEHARRRASMRASHIGRQRTASRALFTTADEAVASRMSSWAASRPIAHARRVHRGAPN